MNEKVNYKEIQYEREKEQFTNFIEETKKMGMGVDFDRAIKYRLVITL
jgi:hypothetical protein